MSSQDCRPKTYLYGMRIGRLLEEGVYYIVIWFPLVIIVYPVLHIIFDIISEIGLCIIYNRNHNDNVCYVLEVDT